MQRGPTCVEEAQRSEPISDLADEKEDSSNLQIKAQLSLRRSLMQNDMAVRREIHNLESWSTHTWAESTTSFPVNTRFEKAAKGKTKSSGIQIVRT